MKNPMQLRINDEQIVPDISGRWLHLIVIGITAASSFTKDAEVTMLSLLKLYGYD